ncbi:MAG: PAS domain S-box protein [Deltaproteobacteria bacterium]|nr:PAS domain S-box protein [Deltaproteobacteria bacterium]
MTPATADATGGSTRPALPSHARLRRRLIWLMGGRLVVASLLLGGVLFATWDPGRGFGGFTASLLLSLIGATFLASVVFGLWASSERSPTMLVTAQIGWDLALATGLIYCTGGAGSALSALYEIIVLVAALTLGPRAITATATGALLLYTAVGVSLSTGWLPPPPDQMPRLYLLATTDLGFALLSNVLGLLLVTGLAGGLAQRLRRAGGELRRAQESAAHYAQLADDIVRSLSSGLATTDTEGAIRTLNPAGERMLGGATEAWAGRPATDFLPVPEDTLASTLPDRGEGEGRRLDGSRFPLGFTASPLRAPDGTPTGTLLSFRDLTDIRELQARAERARQLALLGQLAAGVAHEIRNPLSSISGSVQMVKDASGLADEDRRLMAIVLREVERLDHLVRAMLTAGKPRALRRDELDLRPLAREIATVAARGGAEARGIRIETTLPTQPTRCWGDDDAMRQVIWNLLDNAIGASPDGGQIEIRVEAHDEWVWLEVEDQGEGITPAARDSLFDFFASGRAYGIGIGMALVRQIVDRLNGRVVLADARPTGAIVRVLLPRVTAEGTPVEPASAP